MSDVPDGAALGGIATVVGAAALWILDRRKANANSARQIKNDENATEWQNSLIEQNKELRQELKDEKQRSHDHWLMLSEARTEVSNERNEKLMWKMKFEQLQDMHANAPKLVNEHVEVLKAALAQAHSDIDRLRGRERQS